MNTHLRSENDFYNRTVCGERITEETATSAALPTCVKCERIAHNVNSVEIRLGN